MFISVFVFVHLPTSPAKYRFVFVFNIVVFVFVFVPVLVFVLTRVCICPSSNKSWKIQVCISHCQHVVFVISGTHRTPLWWVPSQIFIKYFVDNFSQCNFRHPPYSPLAQLTAGPSASTVFRNPYEAIHHDYLLHDHLHLHRCHHPSSSSQLSSDRVKGDAHHPQHLLRLFHPHHHLHLYRRHHLLHHN